MAVAVGLYLWQPWASSGSSSDAGSNGGGSTSSADASKPDGAARAFAEAWSKHDFGSVPYVEPTTGTSVGTEYDAIVKSLRPKSVAVSTGAPSVVPGEADQMNAPLHVSWTLPGGQTWSYDSAVQLDRVDGEWRVAWTPAIVQPQLDTGDVLRYTSVAAKRASILDGAGQPLIVDRPVVDVGIEPDKAGDPTAVASQVATILKAYNIDAASLANRVKGAPPTQFVDVITLRDADFAPYATALGAVTGVILHHIDLPLSPSHDFARSLLGTVGPVTKEIVDASNGAYVAGDIGGLSGLEKEYDSMLRGTPGYEVDIVHPSSGGSTPLPTPVQKQAPVDGKPLKTTLDQKVQSAADAALASVTGQPSALVAVRVSTGQVVAVANGPNGGGYDNALLGQLPPGSAFKVVTTTALLEGGLDVSAPVACPPNVVVSGKSFHNYENETLADPPFRTDFAQSCNTAFIGLSSKVGGDKLPTAALSLGIGACWSLGTDAFRGNVPEPQTPVDLAAASFGQGKTLVSPVSLAVAAGTIARGSYVAPRLVANGTTKQPPCASGAANPAPVPASAMSTLRSLMRDVVTSGTATVLASAPGGPVMAKTGTAEYGSDNPPKTHAWMIGYQGDIAFAVYVQDGKSGGTVAGPVALSFLKGLAS